MLLRFTWAATRLPPSKSARFASMPESTTAIVGAWGAGFRELPHSYAAPEEYGQSSPELSEPESFTGESGVTIRPDFFASDASLPAVMSTAIAFADPSFLRRFAPSPLTLSSAPDVPSALWMMT